MTTESNPERSRKIMATFYSQRKNGPPITVVVAKHSCFRANIRFVDIRKATPRRERVNLECSVILVSACEDNQVAIDAIEWFTH